MTVIKRDGSRVEFDINKIKTAITKAFQEVYKDSVFDMGPFWQRFLKIWEEQAQWKELMGLDWNVEQIQDVVENALMDYDKEVAKAYIIYRYNHGLLRKDKNSLVKAVTKKLMAENVDNQNANVDEYSFGGRMGEVTRLVTKQYALDNCMSKMAKNNHLNNEIYIHDLDSYSVGMHNCLSIPFDDLLAKGFKTRQADVRPANSINTACQLIAVIFQIQSLQQFGGVSATHLDWTLAPYVAKSYRKHYDEGIKWMEVEKAHRYAREMTIKETYQGIEGLIHNLNTLQSRSGNQLPFTSVNFGTCTSWEGRLVTKAVLDNFIKGTGPLHSTPIFPCAIFQMMKGVNRQPGDPNYDLYQLALKSTSLRLYPNYANVDWSGNKGYDRFDPKTYFSTMGCRTANGWDINGFGQLKDGRGNICPVTIILPTLAMKADRDVKKFIKLLDKKITEAKDMLIERFEWICSQNPASARFMWENNTMAGYVPEEGIRSALKHGTLAIGQLGLAEALQLLIGKDHTTEEGMELAKEIEQLFKDKCAKFKEEYKLNFGVYYTPAENLCFTALQKFKEKYGIIPNVSDKEFFTNSMHVPVWKQITPFEKIDIESQLTGYSSAGCITYVELDSSVKHNLEGLETIVNYAMDHDIPYFAINIPNDTCQDCGYTDEINDCCPMCGGNNIKRLRRVTGYLTGNYKTAFNLGKQDEVEHRVKHIKEVE